MGPLTPDDILEFVDDAYCEALEKIVLYAEAHGINPGYMAEVFAHAFGAENYQIYLDYCIEREDD